METCKRCGLTDAELEDCEKQMTTMLSGEMICNYCLEYILEDFLGSDYTAEVRDLFINTWLDSHKVDSI